MVAVKLETRLRQFKIKKLMYTEIYLFNNGFSISGWYDWGGSTNSGVHSGNEKNI